MSIYSVLIMAFNAMAMDGIASDLRWVNGNVHLNRSDPIPYPTQTGLTQSDRQC